VTQAQSEEERGSVAQEGGAESVRLRGEGLGEKLERI
jgi:hypothetical protein